MEAYLIAPGLSQDQPTKTDMDASFHESILKDKPFVSASVDHYLTGLIFQDLAPHWPFFSCSNIKKLITLYMYNCLPMNSCKLWWIQEGFAIYLGELNPYLKGQQGLKIVSALTS